MKKYFFVLLFLGLACVPVFAERSWKNETLKYSLYLGPLKVGEASFVTENMTFEGQKVVRLDLVARTTSAAEKLFSLNDSLTTYIDPQKTLPVYFHKHFIEGDYEAEEFTRFTYPAGGGYSVKMHKEVNDGRVKDKTATSNVPVYDMVSAISYVQTMNTSGLKAGQEFKVRLTDGAEMLDDRLVFKGRETVKTSGKKFECLVFKLMEPYVEKGKTKYTDVLTIYVTDDDNRKLIQVDRKFSVGSAKAKINL